MDIHNDAYGNGELTMWQDALIFTSILIVFIVAGIMGYFFAKLREDCGDGEEEMGTSRDVAYKDDFVDFTAEKFANGLEK